MSTTIRVGAIAAAITLGALGVVAVNLGGRSSGIPLAAAATDPALRTITVTGDGTASGRPDVAILQLGVQANGRTAGEALATANASATKLLAAIKAKGVPDQDIVTKGVNVYPSSPPDGTKRITTTYTASNSVQVKVHGVDKAGPIIDAAVAAAGDSAVVQGVNFTFDDAGPLRQDARVKALASAKTKAEQLAQASGIALGRIHQIIESTSGGGVMYAAAATTAASSTPIEPGTQEVSQQVTVVYEISG
jgi:uncharacterized protein YggE